MHNSSPKKAGQPLTCICYIYICTLINISSVCLHPLWFGLSQKCSHSLTQTLLCTKCKFYDWAVYWLGDRDTSYFINACHLNSKGTIVKISTGLHSRKMTTIYLQRLTGLLINTRVDHYFVCVLRLLAFNTPISSCSLCWNKNPLDIRETPRSHKLFGTFSHRRAGLCTSNVVLGQAVDKKLSVLLEPV